MAGVSSFISEYLLNIFRAKEFLRSFICSFSAREIQKEMELAKEEYDMLIRCRGTLDECENGTAAMVTEYYLMYLSRLQQAIPYDAMGSQISISIMALLIFFVASGSCAIKTVS